MRLEEKFKIEVASLITQQKLFKIEPDLAQPYCSWVCNSEKIMRIIQKLRKYFYKELSDEELLLSIRKKDNKIVNAFLELSLIYFFAEHPPKLVELDAPKYLLRTKTRGEVKYMASLNALSIPKVNGKIMIKPNFVSIEGFPVTTDIKTLETVVKKVRDSNPKNPLIIADGPSLFFDSEKVFERKDLLDLAKKYKIDLVNLNKEDYGYLFKDGQKIFIPRVLCGVDYLINLANFKEHTTAKYSSAIKNHLGLVSPFQRLSLHHNNNFLVSMNKICMALRANYHIIDCRKILRGAQQKVYGGYEEKGNGFIFGENLKEVEGAALKRFAKDENI